MLLNVLLNSLLFLHCKFETFIHGINSIQLQAKKIFCFSIIIYTFCLQFRSIIISKLVNRGNLIFFYIIINELSNIPHWWLAIIYLLVCIIHLLFKVFQFWYCMWILCIRNSKKKKMNLVVRWKNHKSMFPYE